MERQPSRPRMFGRIVRLVGVVAAIALMAVPTAGTSSVSNGLYAFIRADSSARLTACAPDGTCTAENIVWHFVYVANANALTEVPVGPRTRRTLKNSFAVERVTYRVFVDGVEIEPAGELTPPPDPGIFRSYAGLWPATVRCPAPASDPCVIEKPAVVPGEVAEVVFAGWGHGANEPNGTYVFKFTVHGTLNGNPVSVTANSRPIEMTD